MNGLDALAGRLPLLGGGVRAGLELLLDSGEESVVDEVAEHVVALARARAQEGVELSLGQDHELTEVLGGEPDALQEVTADLARLAHGRH